MARVAGAVWRLDKDARQDWNAPDMTEDQARSITQDFLDRQGEATMARDIEATLGYCDIPCTLESLQGRAVARSRAEMRAICKAFILALEGKRLTHMVRRCIDAVYKETGCIWATYETRYVREGQLLTEEPYLSFAILKRRPGGWKVSAMQFAVAQDSPANLTLRDWQAERIVVPPEPAHLPPCGIETHRAVFEKLAQ